MFNGFQRFPVVFALSLFSPSESQSLFLVWYMVKVLICLFWVSKAGAKSTPLQRRLILRVVVYEELFLCAGRLWNRWRGSELWQPQRFHYFLSFYWVLNEADDPHLVSTAGAL